MAATALRHQYSFGRFELHAAEGRLLDAGQPVPLSGRALDLLVALVESRGRLATKADLLGKVWPGLVVEENTLQAQVSALRKLLGADAIVTVSGRGYRFALDVAASEVERPADAGQDQLPRPATSFVGRTKEIEDLKRLLDRSRLLTIVGVGGCGKTRLAIEVAAGQRRTLPDGVCFIDMAALADASLLAQRFAAAAGVAERPDARLVDDIFRHFEDKRALLIFDNAEHLLAPCAQLIDELLSRCPKLSILVTSRERLGVLGELSYRVPSLGVPGPGDADPRSLADCESVVLFVERARMLRPHFSVTMSNAAVLASICRRLDGIPLAIELAAPRLRSMPLEEILERLDRRFSLLSDGSNTRIARQRTLRSLIDWSYELLTPAEQAVFCRTAVFAGGWSLQAAERVCAGREVVDADVLDILTSLVDKSLVSTEERNGLTRYRVLETIRQYGLERLRENLDEFRRCKHLHLTHFAAVGPEADKAMAGPDQLNWLDQLETDHDNIRSALSWALGEGADALGALTLAGGYWRLWYTRGYTSEGSDWLSRALAGAPENAPPGPLGNAFNGAGVMATVRADFDTAKTMFERTLEIRRASGDKSGTSSALNNLGAVANAIGDRDRATALYTQSLELAEEAGDRARMVVALHNLGSNALDQARYDDALDLYERCLPINRQLANGLGVAADLAALGIVLGRKGDYAGARRRVLQGLELFWSYGDRWRVTASISELARIALLTGLADRAARFWGATETMREQIGAPLRDDQRLQQAEEVASARAALGDGAAFDRAWQEGTAMSWEKVIRYASATGAQWPDDWRDTADSAFMRHQEISGIHQD